MSNTIDDLRLKYRPRKFSEIVGQDEFVKSFREMAKRGRPNDNAILLTGTRGTGKTTSARVLAAALNCTNISDDGEPCGKCRECESALSGSGSMAVAQEVNCSGFNVQQARAFNETMKIKTSAKWRVVIYDEAQELKSTAPEFLKPVEEPEPGVFYVFCTTHAHKLPEALLSRMTPYSLRDVPHETLVKHIGWIAEQESIDVTGEDLDLIAGGADGSVRQAISRLQQFRDGLPLTDPRVSVAIADALIDGNLAAALFAIKKAEGHGSLDARLTTEELHKFYGDALTVRYSPDTADIILRNRSESYVDLVVDAAENDDITQSELVRGVSIMASAINSMSTGNSTTAQLEAAVVRILSPEEDQLAKRIVSLIEETMDENDGQVVLNVTHNHYAEDARAGLSGKRTKKKTEPVEDVDAAEENADDSVFPEYNGASEVENWPPEDEEAADDVDDAGEVDADEDEVEEVAVEDEVEDEKPEPIARKKSAKKRKPEPEPVEEEEEEEEEELADDDHDDDVDEIDAVDDVDDVDDDEDVDVEEDDEDDADDVSEQDNDSDDDELDDDLDDEEELDEDDDEDYDAEIRSIMLERAGQRKSKRVREILEDAYIAFEEADDDGELLVIELSGVRSDKMFTLVEKIAHDALDEMGYNDLDVEVFDADADEEE